MLSNAAATKGPAHYTRTPTVGSTRFRHCGEHRVCIRKFERFFDFTRSNSVGRRALDIAGANSNASACYLRGDTGRQLIKVGAKPAACFPVFAAVPSHFAARVFRLRSVLVRRTGVHL